MIFFYYFFSDDIVCDCQTLNVGSNKGIQGIYQKLGYVNGRTSWNSSTGSAVWFAPDFEGWFFGSMDIIGQNMATVLVFETGNNSCPYNISSDQWQYYDSGAGGWTYVNVGDFSVQCLSGNFN